jgi:hypothetical protein
MKRTPYILTTVILLSFFSCKEKSLHDLFSEYDSLLYIADSAFISSLDLKHFEDLSTRDLEKLYVKPDDSEPEAIDNVIRILIESDTNNDVFWQFKQYSLKALHSFHLESDLRVYTWYIWFSDGEQGPEIIMASVFQKENLINCFELAKLYTYSFSRAWNSGKEEGQIFKNGQVTKTIIDPSSKNDRNTPNTVRRYSIENGYLMELTDSLF